MADGESGIGNSGARSYRALLDLQRLRLFLIL
jgi:hypothetical protein